jgi:hypothetical protein
MNPHPSQKVKFKSDLVVFRSVERWSSRYLKLGKRPNRRVFVAQGGGRITDNRDWAGAGALGNFNRSSRRTEPKGVIRVPRLMYIPPISGGWLLFGRQPRPLDFIGCLALLNSGAFRKGLLNRPSHQTPRHVRLYWYVHF